MNNEEVNLTNDYYSLHRILKTDIKKDPDVEEDEIIFGCGCFWGAEKCFWKLPGVVTTSVGYAGGKKKQSNLLRSMFRLNWSFRSCKGYMG